MERVRKKSALITNEAQHFVDTGQQSVVDRYLSQEQTMQMTTERDFYQERLQRSLVRLSVLTGVSVKQLMCESLTNPSIRSLKSNENVNRSPIIKQANSTIAVAESTLQESKAQLYPKIVGLASYGEMEEAHLIKPDDYAAGVGIVWPFGNITNYEKINLAKREIEVKRADQRAAILYVENLNKKYDEEIESDQLRLARLNKELILSRKAFSVAESRYSSLEGTLVDLRDAFQNLARVKTDIQATRAKYLQARGAKALLNGNDAN